MADGQEKTEEATDRRRKESRDRGTVAKSADLTSAAVMIALLMVMPGAMSSIGLSWLQGMNHALFSIPTTASVAHLANYTHGLLMPCLAATGILIGTVMAVGVASTVGQVGFHLSPEAMKPNFEKINPLSGIKRFFSATILVEAFKAFIKTVVFAYVAYGAVRGSWGQLMQLSQLPPGAALSVVGAVLKTVAMRVVGVWAAMAGLDYYYQRKNTAKQIRMTKEEVKQEYKQQETSAEIKGARMRRRRQLLKKGMMAAVQTADVIVTNPTHYAVALKYDAAISAAPIVVAKGADLIAARIREEGKKHEVPLVPNPPLARALYKQCEVGDPVPPELFLAVAELLAYVYRAIRGLRSNDIPGAPTDPR